MFKDVELSRDVMTSFRESPQARAASSSEIELSVHVLTQGYWPTYPPADVILPGAKPLLKMPAMKLALSGRETRRRAWSESHEGSLLSAAESRCDARGGPKAR